MIYLTFIMTTKTSIYPVPPRRSRTRRSWDPSWICIISMGPIHTEEHRQVGGSSETCCPLRTQPLPQHVKCQSIDWPTEMAVKKSHMPGDHLQNPAWTNPVSNYLEQVSPTPTKTAPHPQPMVLPHQHQNQYRGGPFLPRTVRDWTIFLGRQ